MLLALGGLVFGLLVIEVALRVANVSYPNFYHSDYYCGSSLRSGARGCWRLEGRSYVRINSDGLRDVEHLEAKPPHTYRIAVLGDSYAEALQIPVNQTFWKVLEAKLVECAAIGNKRVEVINFGVSGYGTGQELVLLRRKVWEYSPDAVVLAITTGNDIRNNSRELEPEKQRPFFTLADGRLVEDDSFRDDAHFQRSQTRLWTALHWIMDFSRILQVVNRVINVVRARREERAMRTAGSALGHANVGLDMMVYRPPRDPKWQAAWDVTEALLVEMDKEVTAKGALFLAVTLSNPDQVNPDQRVEAALARTLGVSDLYYPDERIKQVGERAGFEVLNLAQPLHSYAVEHQVYLHGFPNTCMGCGHWNFEGHRLAGELISHKLCEMLSPPVQHVTQ